MDKRIKILTPFVKNLAEIKSETKIVDGVTYSRFEYPNGFVLETEQTAEEINVKTNRPLIDNGDGTYSIPK